jgi:hypothetical protein
LPTNRGIDDYFAEFTGAEFVALEGVYLACAERHRCVEFRNQHRHSWLGPVEQVEHIPTLHLRAEVRRRKT